ncbi:MAG: HNH endonuclease [Cetobacterium sp.]
MKEKQKCYICGVILEGENRSAEHIIPNCIGGRLKSFDLICRNCNSSLGETIDINFGKEYQILMILFDISRDRGEVQPLKAEGRDGNKYSLYSDGTVELRSPIVKEKSIEIPRYMERQYLKKFEKKDVPIETNVKYSIPPKFEIKLGDITEELKLGILKIALNFAILQNVSVEKLSKCIKELKIRKEESVIPYNCDVIVDTIFHRIKLEVSKGVLFSTITLFSIFNFIVILNENYEEDFQECEYIEKLFGDKEIDIRIEVLEKINYDHLWDLFYSSLDLYYSNLNKLMIIASENDRSKLIKKISAEIYEKILATPNYDEVTRSREKLESLLIEPINKFLGALLKDEDLMNQK